MGWHVNIRWVERGFLVKLDCSWIDSFFKCESKVSILPTGWVCKRHVDCFHILGLWWQVATLTQHTTAHTMHFIETEDEAMDLIAMMMTNVEGKNQDFILNMDLMPFPYPYHASNMLDVKGKKTVHARAFMTNTKHVTLAETVTTSRKMLPLFLIFKGLPHGCIVMHE